MKREQLLSNKYYLYATEFFAGMSVMAVELGASRLLAPYFSSSQIVWTIIIGTIMIAMALGNIYGGKSADKNPNPDKLYMRLLIAAVWIAAIPVVGKYVIIGISLLLVVTINTNFLIWAAFLACMTVFVFPLFLLGTVTPSLAKYTVNSLEDSGKTVGTLGAFNTIGSIIGTFLPTFVTIPAVGTSVTFFIFSGILFLLGSIYFLAGKRRRKTLAVLTAVFFLCTFFGTRNGFAFWEKNLLYEGESVYNYLQVKETDRNVILSTNVLFGVQSILQKDGELTGMYYDYALAAPLLAGISAKDLYSGSSFAPASVLILGMGTGTYATQLQKYFPQITVEGVEIDPKITQLARDYFQLAETVTVTTYDGRAYLSGVNRKYDVIMVDAYQDITIPFQMSSVEFFGMVKEHLNANGVMVVNMNMHTESSGSITDYLSDTIANVFDHVYTIDVEGSTNRELFATGNPQALSWFFNLREGIPDADLRALMAKVSNELKDYQKGNYLLTDDRAPVEMLGMKVIDGLIQNELTYYRQVFREKGISGLLE